MNYLKQNHLSLLIILFLAVQGFFGGGLSLGAGVPDSTTITNPWTFEQAVTFSGAFATQAANFTVGTNGDSATRINHGFCNIYADTSIAASSTEVVDCGAGSNGATALTGITAGDVCFINFATTTPNTAQGLHVSGVSASSTSGFITLDVSNQTGAAFTWTAAASSSLPYLCIAS